MPSLTSATVLNPSDLVGYMDGKRAIELLFDDTEIGPDDDYPDVADIDDIDRAVMLAQEAWYRVMMACQHGDIYLQRELIDLANDAARGQPLRRLVSLIFWCSLLDRRKYVEGEPQAEDPGYKRSEAMLEQLESGHRIFVLKGVAITNEAGTLTGQLYENVLGPPTALSVGELGSDTTYRDPLNRFFGCTDGFRPRFGSDGEHGCC